MHCGHDSGPNIVYLAVISVHAFCSGEAILRLFARLLLLLSLSSMGFFCTSAAYSSPLLKGGLYDIYRHSLRIYTLPTFTTAADNIWVVTSPKMQMLHCYLQPSESTKYCLHYAYHGNTLLSSSIAGYHKMGLHSHALTPPE